jgi:hypothetical protein
VQIDITDVERTELGDLVEQAYRNLKEEIYKTEDREFKEALKRREAAFLSILQKLGRGPAIQSVA